MENAILYLRLGLFHVLDKTAVDHILFLSVLAVVYTFSDWKKVIWMVTSFTLGHTFTLTLAAYDVIDIKSEWVEFLIPVTILFTAFANILFSGKKHSRTENSLNLIFAFAFGLIHGLGFSSYFRMLIDKDESKILPLLEFALGIEGAQIVIVIIILTLGFIAERIFGIKRRDWILVVSALVAGMTIPMLQSRIFW